MFPVTRTSDPAEREQAEARGQALRRHLLVRAPSVARRRARRAGPCTHRPARRGRCLRPTSASRTTWRRPSTPTARGAYPARRAPGTMGYAPWSEGLGLVLRQLADELPGRSILVDECGLGTAASKTDAHDRDDDWRVSYLTECLGEVERAHRRRHRHPRLLPLDRRRQLRMARGLRRALRVVRSRSEPEAQRPSWPAATRSATEPHDEPPTSTRSRKQAGRRAAAHVENGMRVGLGTGSTVHWTIVDSG